MGGGGGSALEVCSNRRQHVGLVVRIGIEYDVLERMCPFRVALSMSHPYPRTISPPYLPAPFRLKNLHDS